MRIVRPYGESVAPAAGSQRLLQLKKQLRDKLGGDQERAIPAFAASHDELLIAQWISTIDKIATKPKGTNKPTPAQLALREKLGEAAWQVVRHRLTRADSLKKHWTFKIHPYPTETKPPKVVDGREIPDPRGRWYRRFAGDVAPAKIDAEAVVGANRKSRRSAK